MLMFSCISSTTEEAATEGTCSSMERSSSKVRKSDWMLVTAPEPPPAYSSSTRLVPMPWISLRMYWRPVAEMATTRITEAVPMTMPSAVSTKRTFDERKLSMASLAISLSMIVCRALAMVFSNEIRRVRSEAMCSYRMPQWAQGFRRLGEGRGAGRGVIAPPLAEYGQISLDRFLASG